MRAKGAAKRGPREPPDDLREVVVEALRAAGAVKLSASGTAIKKALPKPYQPFAVRAQALLSELADQGRAYRWAKGKTVVVFAGDPIASLDRLVPLELQGGPLTEVAIKAAVKRLAPGHEELIGEWLKSAASRGLVFAQAGKGKKYGLEPDVRGVLSPVLQALRKVLPALEASRVAPSKVLALLAAELGATGAAPQVTPRREQFLTALRALKVARPSEALFSLGDLRARLDMDKQQFDDVALELSREGAVSLHHHDHPGALSESELSQLVRDARGTYYIGIALRRET